MSEDEAKVVVVELAKVKISDVPAKLKNLIISIWLHFFLNRIGCKRPDFLSALLTDINATKRQRIIITARYAHKLKFKEITGLKGVNCELRHVMREHKQVIDKLINL